MSTQATTLQKIQALQEQITSLQDEELRALRNRRQQLANEIDLLDAEIAGLGGPQPESKNGASTRKSFGKTIALPDLKNLLSGAPNKTVSLRKVGLNLANIQSLSAANPQLLKMGGVGAWPTVTLLK